MSSGRVVRPETACWTAEPLEPSCQLKRSAGKDKDAPVVVENGNGWIDNRDRGHIKRVIEAKRRKLRRLRHTSSIALFVLLRLQRIDFRRATSNVKVRSRMFSCGSVITCTRTANIESVNPRNSNKPKRDPRELLSR